MTGQHASHDPWMGRDHVLVVQAARNLDTEPAYARQLLATCEDPLTAAVQLVQLLMSERVEQWAEWSGE